MLGFRMYLSDLEHATYGVLDVTQISTHLIQ